MSITDREPAARPTSEWARTTQAVADCAVIAAYWVQVPALSLALALLFVRSRPAVGEVFALDTDALFRVALVCSRLTEVALGVQVCWLIATGVGWLLSRHLGYAAPLTSDSLGRRFFSHGIRYAYVAAPLPWALVLVVLVLQVVDAAGVR